MAQWANVLVAKRDDLSSASGTHVEEQGNQLLHAVFWPPHVHCGNVHERA